jgi:hypothetical protein
MEGLSILSAGEYHSRLLEFKQWIASAQQDIDAMSSEVSCH